MVAVPGRHGLDRAIGNIMTKYDRETSMAEIGEPERRRVLVPNEEPAHTPMVVPVPEREPVKIPAREPT